jgi:hypothetical protein
LKQNHIVRLCRVRFEIAIVEVKAEDEEAAMEKALSKHIPDAKWHLLPFDAEAYVPHVESCVSDHTIDANSAEPGDREEYLAELRSPLYDHDVRYMLLQADVADGEGRVLIDPWYPQHPGLRELDMISDWGSTLQDMHAKALANFEASDEPTGRAPCPSRVIIPFPVRKKPESEE